MKLNELVSAKKTENHITDKQIIKALDITYPTYRKKINDELININEIRVLKSILKISNSELVGIF